MSNILVSICCITFNHEKFIAYALDGFLMQKTNFEFEILINDDCSDDNTSNILRNYEERFPGRFKISYQTENQFSKGVKPYNHILFPKVKGKYVALCEGDDYWTDPNKLQKQVDFLEINNTYSLCFHKCIMVDENNVEVESVFSHLKEKNYSGKEILEKWSIPTASTLFRTKYFNQIFKRAKTPGYFYGDTPMFLTLLENGKARCLVDNMSAYRIHKGGISWSTSKKHNIVLYRHYKTLRRDFNGKYSKIMATIISQHAHRMGTSFIRSGQFVHGIKFLIISVYYDKTVLTNHILQKLTLSNSKLKNV